MRFCKKCKGIMKPTSNGMVKCVGCGFKTKEGDLIVKEKIIKSPEVGEGVIKDKNIFADYPFKCEKCNYTKAEVIERPPSISDEDTLTYLKCGKCGWTENLARKAT